jgi:hypothetical protein
MLGPWQSYSTGEASDEPPPEETFLQYGRLMGF